jgi:hemoglobin-like flavoprotein
MTPEQITLVQTSWAKVAPIADQAADIFYDRLFEIAPEARPLFSEDMAKQKRALMGMLATAVNGLTKLDTILPAVRALGERHNGYGATDEHYDLVAAALLFTLGKGLGEGFSPEVEEAWTKAYATLAGVMIEAAANARAA